MGFTILVDFGSTFTKATVVDMHKQCIAYTFRTPSTVGTDASIGLCKCFDAIQPVIGIEELRSSKKIASSSAAGGLRMIVVGLTESLSLTAGKNAAYGAGAKIIKTFFGNLTKNEIEEIGDIQPEIILLCGGYENGNTPVILDALKKHQAPAAFFLVGNYLETSPDLVKRMVEEGHTVGNHTYHHPDMSKISTKETFSKELSDLEMLYTKTTGQSMTRYYRPPQGKYSEANLKMADELGYQTFFWSLAYVDWYEDKQPTREEAFQKLLGRIHPGAIVLLHSTSKTNAQILDELLTRWEEMGYRFGQLEELTAA